LTMKTVPWEMPWTPSLNIRFSDHISGETIMSNTKVRRLDGNRYPCFSLGLCKNERFIDTVVLYFHQPDQLAISQSSRGLGLVACLEGQKINNMPNMASRTFSYIPKVICEAWNATIIIRHLLIYIFSSLTAITCCPSKRPSKHQLDPVLYSIGKWL
jgi:hypothetical protein